MRSYWSLPIVIKPLPRTFDHKRWIDYRLSQQAWHGGTPNACHRYLTENSPTLIRFAANSTSLSIATNTLSAGNSRTTWSFIDFLEILFSLSWSTGSRDLFLDYLTVIYCLYSTQYPSNNLRFNPFISYHLTGAWHIFYDESFILNMITYQPPVTVSISILIWNTTFSTI